MIVFDNKIIGINENNIPKDLFKNIGIGKIIKGSYKLKLIGETYIPYYDNPLLIFDIIEYNNIEIIEL